MIRSITSKIKDGIPFLKREIEARISLKTPLFISKPIYYHIEFGHACNARCITCFQKHEKKPELEGDIVKSILRQAKDLSGRGFVIAFFGGEPLIYKQFFEVLEFAYNSGINFGFTTNGYLLTKEMVRKILAYNPFSIGISIESLDSAINEKIRPYKHGTIKVLEGISNVIEEKKRIGAKTGIILKPVITGLNYKLIPELVKHFGKDTNVVFHPQPYNYCEGHDKSLWINDLTDLRRSIDELIKLRKEGYVFTMDDDMLRELVNHFDRKPEDCLSVGKMDLKGKQRGCYVGATTLFFNRDGSVQFCPFFPPIGNVYRESLKDIWYSEKAKVQREKMLDCDITCWQACVRPTSLWTKGLSYMRLR